MKRITWIHFNPGFRPCFRTETALPFVALVNDRRKDWGEDCVPIGPSQSLWGFSFESVCPTWELCCWFCSFGVGRSQVVVLGDRQLLHPMAMGLGVPHGSTVSPMLFNVCTNPLGEVVWVFGLRCHQYARDTQLFIALPSGPGG